MRPLRAGVDEESRDQSYSAVVNRGHADRRAIEAVLHHEQLPHSHFVQGMIGAKPHPRTELLPLPEEVAFSSPEWHVRDVKAGLVPQGAYCIVDHEQMHSNLNSQ